MTMSQQISTGSFVEVLDDNFKGKVIKIQNNEAVVLTADGFELSFPLSQLIPVGDGSLIRLTTSFSAIEAAKQQKVTKNHDRVNRGTKARQDETVLEIDPHIEKLVMNFKHLTNFDILNIQVDTALSQVEFAIESRIP